MQAIIGSSIKMEIINIHFPSPFSLMLFVRYWRTSHITTRKAAGGDGTRQGKLNIHNTENHSDNDSQHVGHFHGGHGIEISVCVLCTICTMHL